MNNRFEVLDSFRGIAALMVAVYHFHVTGVITDLPLVRNSYLFVEFFFVLSGFVIGHSYMNKVNTTNDLKRFVIKRFARLYPLHIVMTLAFIPFAAASMVLNIDFGERFDFYPLITNILLIQALGVHTSDTWNIPAWSISTEFYTYLLFGLFSVFLIKRKTIVIPLIISALSLLLLYNYSSMADTVNLAILRCTYSFFLGVAASNLHKSVNAPPWTEVAAIIGMLLVLSLQKINGADTTAFLMPLLFFCIIIIFSKQRGPISSLLNNNLLQKMGALSFSIYLTHLWVGASIKSGSIITKKILGYEYILQHNGISVIDFGLGHLNDIVYIPYILIVLALSALTYKYIEKPWQRKINAIRVC